MKTIQNYIAIFMALFLQSYLIQCEPLFPTKSIRYDVDAEWVIIGAGPAGIIVLGVLLDLGTDPKSIIWVDPEFNVGRMGKYYSTVPGNAKTKQFIEFINACNTFQEANSPAVAKLYDMDQETEYPLQVIVEPLCDISKYLCTKVNCKTDKLCSLSFENNVWKVGLTNSPCIKTSHVILAVGAHPKKLDYDCKYEIPLDLALDKNVLGQLENMKDIWQWQEAANQPYYY